MYGVKEAVEHVGRPPCSRGWVSGRSRTGPSREVRREAKVGESNGGRWRSHRSPPVGSEQ